MSQYSNYSDRRSAVPASFEKVKRYTKDLVYSKDKKVINRAFLGLAEMTCPIEIFEKCQVEKILQKFYKEKVEYFYQVNVLTNKLNTLRCDKYMENSAQFKVEEGYDPEHPMFETAVDAKVEKSRLLEEHAEYKPTRIRGVPFKRFNR
ncbi:hypothetical protein GCK72_004216 [Caenorhabditis remanei]|uniref:Uncharacterized protein n=1 Tax=Caenorhabditis remanei TaxID=31234 RepID=A0A6A5HB30_CAERE|nr:hypothetical protein GCK72_004216 [Caenorhabditis remanei]KAF1764269.1 hypothetical protein GCK72_004216 [Caenorhabditis remanei]